MIDYLIQEFIAIVEHLKNKPEKFIKHGYLIAEKSDIAILLEQNAYETVEKKLRAWCALRWIDADPNRLTRRIRLAGKTVRAIKIDLGVYEALKEWG